MFPVQPSPDRVILKPLTTDIVTGNGISISATTKMHTKWGILVAAGTAIPLNTAAGESEIYILYGAGADRGFEIGDENYVIVRGCDILAIVGNISES